jgi:hypothetical protein
MNEYGIYMGNIVRNLHFEDRTRGDDKTKFILKNVRYTRNWLSILFWY